MSALVLPCSVVDDQHWWLIGPGQQCPESPFFDIHFTNRPDSEQALKLLSSPLSPLLSSLRWIAVSHVSCALVKVSRIGLFGPQTICGLYLYKEFLLPRDNKIEKWYSYKCRGIYTPLMNCTMECTEPLHPHFFHTWFIERNYFAFITLNHIKHVFSAFYWSWYFPSSWVSLSPQ